MFTRNQLVRHPRGAALIVGFIMVLLLLAMAMAFASRMTSNQLRAESDIAGERAYELAQTSNTLKIQKLWADFKSKPPSQRIAWIGGDATGSATLNPAHAPDYQDANWVDSPSGGTCTRIKVLALQKSQWAVVRFTTWAQVKDDMRDRSVVRKVQRAIRFSLQTANVFDYVYFADNYGTLDGDKIIVYGPVGANGDITLSNNPTVDGKIVAAKNPITGAAGQVQGLAGHDTVPQYQDIMSHNSLMRPTNPVAPSEDQNNNALLDPGEDRNKNGILDTFPYALGYDGTQPVSTMQNPTKMPELGNLSLFKDAANSYVRPARPDLAETGGGAGSVVKQLKDSKLDPTNPANYITLIDRTYGDKGETGMAASIAKNSVGYTNLPAKIDPNPATAWKNGNLALIGTAEQPLVIFGPVVVTNDLVIKGTITGQGTFYVGRNLHVVGDVTYKNPPVWKSNDIYFSKTSADNAGRDAVGFSARGNIVMGNYTDMDIHADNWDVVKRYMMPPFTKPESLANLPDASIGYGNGAGGVTFSGDYSQLDGDKMYLDNNTSPTTANRAFFQSTFSEAYIKFIATSKPHTLNGVFYAGHFFGGRAEYLTLFGSLITHDEGIVSGWATTLIYDPRISQMDTSTYVNIALPGNATIETLYWKDMAADDASSLSPDW